MAWSPPEISIIGNNDPKVSPYLKAWVIQENTCVCGVIGEGTSQEIMANWNSPFEEDSLGGRFQKIGGLVQYMTGRTSKGKIASQQIWEGNRPHQFSLALKFYALADAQKEVVAPIKALEKMLAPQVNAIAPGGRIPFPVAINIGRIALYDMCVLVSMTTPLDKEKTKDGYLVRAEVQLQVETLSMLNRSDIDRTYG
jgi:hypothetical protein